MCKIRAEILSVLGDEELPPWILADDLVATLAKIGHAPDDAVAELSRLMAETVVISAVSLLGDTLVCLASRAGSDQTNLSS